MHIESRIEGEWYPSKAKYPNDQYKEINPNISLPNSIYIPFKKTDTKACIDATIFLEFFLFLIIEDGFSPLIKRSNPSGVRKTSITSSTNISLNPSAKNFIGLSLNFSEIILFHCDGVSSAFLFSSF